MLEEATSFPKEQCSNIDVRRVQAMLGPCSRQGVTERRFGHQIPIRSKPTLEPCRIPIPYTFVGWTRTRNPPQDFNGPSTVTQSSSELSLPPTQSPVTKGSAVHSTCRPGNGYARTHHRFLRLQCLSPIRNQRGTLVIACDQCLSASRRSLYLMIPRTRSTAFKFCP